MYNYVHISFEEAEYSANSEGKGTLRILEVFHLVGLFKKTKIYKTSTSELYGLEQAVP
jgi:GDPmannose 4,6-dehydratase